MQENFIAIGIVGVIVIILISLIFVYVNLQKTVTIKILEQKQEEEKRKQASIEMLVELVAKRITSKNELTTAIFEVAKNCPFPPKVKGLAPNSSKIYLNFVLLVASHKNADAKLIAFMSEELKKANPTYKTEIDIYEAEGIHQRGNRV